MMFIVHFHVEAGDLAIAQRTVWRIGDFGGVSATSSPDAWRAHRTKRDFRKRLSLAHDLEPRRCLALR